MSQWEDRYRADIRLFLEGKGVLSVVDTSGRRVWEEDAPDSDLNVSTYGYRDLSASRHLYECGTASLVGAEVYERTYSMFTDTFHDNENEVGINVKYVSCNCGKVSNRYGRWTGSFGDLIRKLTGADGQPASFQL